MVFSTKTTLSEFRAFLSTIDADQQYQLIDGEIVMSPAPQLAHQRISRELLFLLKGVIPDGEVWYAPTDVQINEYNVYQPDIFWISTANDILETTQGFSGAPDLVIEILSPGTAKQDKQEKFKGYEQAGVREYWVADPINGFLEVWTLEDGAFKRLGVFSDDDTFPSKALDQSVLLKGIFTKPST